MVLCTTPRTGGRLASPELISLSTSALLTTLHGRTTMFAPNALSSLTNSLTFLVTEPPRLEACRATASLTLAKSRCRWRWPTKPRPRSWRPRGYHRPTQATRSLPRHISSPCYRGRLARRCLPLGCGELRSDFPPLVLTGVL